MSSERTGRRPAGGAGGPGGPRTNAGRRGRANAGVGRAGRLARALAAVCAAFAGAFAPRPAAAEDDPLRARLELADQYVRLPERIRDALRPPQWLPDGDRFVQWSAAGPNRGTWVVVDARRRAVTPLVPAASLRAQLARLVGRPVDAVDEPAFALAPGGRAVAFRFEGRAFAVGLSDRRVVALGPADRAAWALSPDHVPSPDGRAVAVPRGGGFAVLDGGGRVLVERAGESDYAWEVPPRAWAPGGRHLAAWRNDARGAHKIPVVDYASPLERVTMVPYAKVGTPLVRPELYVIEPAAGRAVRVPPGEGETYDWLAGWRPDGGEALVLRLSRDGKRLDLVAVAPATGATRLVLREERPATFVGALDFAEEGWRLQVTPLADNRCFLWMSERDGWRHVYLYDYAGRLERQITRGAFPVHEVVGAAPAGDAVFVVASAEAGAPYDRLPYRAPLAGGPLRRLAAEPGVHRATLAPSGRYFVDGHSSRSRPRSWDVIDAEGRRPFRYARADASALAALHYAPPEPLTALAADGATTLYGVLYKPFDFDPRKRYPVVDHIYAGPFTTVVPWHYAGNADSLRANALAQAGFVVMLLDARGTPGRSKAFQDANYGRVGQIEIADHVGALRQAAATRPYLDLTRAGIHGHSWGGYFALRGMLTAPEFFKAGYAGAPGALEEEAIINEPHLGLPARNPAGYRAGSNLLAAGNLRGALKMMHGTDDVNASLSTTMRMAEALIKAGKRFDLLVMPGQGHSPRGDAGRYYRDDVARFFARELGGPR